jgi:AcrR family transcriptional regulator
MKPEQMPQTGNAQPTISRQLERSERTRSELLRAAEAIFVRDGFEASRIEDIAAEAGRSRGAFYANFDSKTEVFLALRSLAVRRRAREIRQRVEAVTGQEERYDAVLHYLLEQICDTQTLLLQIEFKLFALRHPEMLAELSEKHLEASTSINRQELADLFPEKQTDEGIEEMRYTTLLMESLMEGFALNAMFSPQILDAARLGAILPEMMATIFPRIEHSPLGPASEQTRKEPESSFLVSCLK